MSKTLRDALTEDLKDYFRRYSLEEKVNIYIYLKNLLSAAYYNNENNNSKTSIYSIEKGKQGIFDELCKEAGISDLSVSSEELIDLVARKLSEDLLVENKKDLSVILNNVLDDYHKNSTIKKVDEASNYLYRVLQYGDIDIYSQSQRELVKYLNSKTREELLEEIYSHLSFRPSDKNECISMYCKKIAINWCKENDIHPIGYGNK